MPDRSHDAHDADDICRKAYDFLRRKDWPNALERFRQIFDGHNPAIATCIGFIYDQKGSTFYDPEKAIEYYTIAANGGDAYAQYALGGILFERGESAQAINWYARCSAAGDANCSYMAYRLNKVRKNEQEASIFLERASNQGHPVAIQKFAVYYMLGRFGIRGILKGIQMYIKNVPKLINFTKSNIR